VRILAPAADHRPAPTAVREALVLDGEALKAEAPGGELVLLST
jgi:hypothetical protein